MASQRIKVYVKRQLRIDRLNFEQRHMLGLGTLGLNDVKQRVRGLRNTDDLPVKKLSKRYAIQKTKRGLGNRRNLTVTGDMLRNFTVRTVSVNEARASMTRAKEKIKARANQKNEEWAAFSPRNQKNVTIAGQKLLSEKKLPFIVLERRGTD